MAAILIFTSWKEPWQSAKTRGEWGPKLDDMNLVWARVMGFFLFVCLSKWNALPSEIVNIKSADRFKKLLFEHFSQ